MQESIEQIHLQIQGRVQGVWFRATAREKALELGLTGWVRNLPDRQVELIAEGPRNALDAMVDWCRVGPPLARVEDVKIERGQATDTFASFEVR